MKKNELKKKTINELRELKEKIENEIEERVRLDWTKLVSLRTAIDFLAKGEKLTSNRLEKEYKQRLKELKRAYMKEIMKRE